MKTIRSKFLLPVAMFMIAIVAAFASQAPNDENAGWEQGYIHTTNPCEVSVQCSTTSGKICEIQNKQVFGMNAASQCTRTLFLPYQAK